ncbi:uncharacterized protein LOC114695083 [Peromyscus leucopus]|uniref:uncharacterized protein LOC114695083 n=1 Tax=Peromyscus leucopus TaxID=10041 RepID=UPI0010A0F6A4|nr:uncharacterized protein LOC114695083 [Peromyscus leucopus]
MGRSARGFPLLPAACDSPNMGVLGSAKRPAGLDRLLCHASWAFARCGRGDAQARVASIPLPLPARPACSLGGVEASEAGATAPPRAWLPRLTLYLLQEPGAPTALVPPAEATAFSFVQHSIGSMQR